MALGRNVSFFLSVTSKHRDERKVNCTHTIQQAGID